MVLQRWGLCAGSFLPPGPPPSSSLPELRSPLSRGAQAGPARGTRTLCRRRRRAPAAGTKTPLPAPRPRPGPERRPGKGGGHPVVSRDVVRCGGFRHRGAASAVPGPAAPSLSARGSCHQESAPAWGAVPVGWGAAIGTPRQRIWGRAAAFRPWWLCELGGPESPPGAPQFRPHCTMGQKAGWVGFEVFLPRGVELASPAMHTYASPPPG